MNELLVASKVVTSRGVHAPGWVHLSGGKIVGVGSGQFEEQHDSGALAQADQADAPQLTVHDFGNATIVPGFVDAHVHGGGGAAYPEVVDSGVAVASASRTAHLRHGTTTTMASLVAAQPAALLTQVRTLAPLVDDGTLRGIHLEGPWLNPIRKGAHEERALRHPDPAEIDELLAAAHGAIRMVTIAPELPGALAAIAQFVAAGVVVAIGHTDADYACTRRAIDAGATVATHLFNAMPPLLHRAPGPVLALLEDERVMLELVADGVHVDAGLVRWIEHAAGTDRIMLVTDAMGAAACGDGSYALGALEVTVAEGVARITGTDTIAGSTATMDALFRQRAILGANAGVSLAVGALDRSLVAAVQMTATNPAAAMGWHDVGDIAEGMRADLVVLNEHLVPEAVCVAGNTHKLS